MNINSLDNNNLILILTKVDNYLQDEATLRILSVINKKFREAARKIKCERELKGIIFPIHRPIDLVNLIVRSRNISNSFSSIQELKINIEVQIIDLIFILQFNKDIINIDISNGYIFCNSYLDLEIFISFLIKLKKLEILRLNFNESFNSQFFRVITQMSTLLRK